MKILYIEGADCIGKSTLINELKAILENEKYRVFTTKEPDYCVRKALISSGEDRKEYCYYAQRLLMGVSHIQKLEDIKKIKASGDYDVVIIDRTSIISDYVYGSKLNLDMNYTVTQSSLEPMIKEMNTELKDDSYLIIGMVSDDEFEKRVSSRPDNQDYLDTYENKMRVRKAYNSVIEEVMMPGRLSERLFNNHFNDMYVLSFDDMKMAVHNIISDIVKDGAN